eukprot:GFUD01026601.1.p1 GENE.GFUD01026601.1~~GFUD01026601.1.p1  ORF type:complete len:363 (+),score=121.88 GFUD01026601.1:66-1154(+)
MSRSSRVMAVKLGHLVDPRTVWAYPLHEQGDQQVRILSLERQLVELPGGGQRLTDHTTGILVAVRRSPDSLTWQRGRLDQLCRDGKQVLATVFLIDYGEVLEGLNVDGCIRQMPTKFRKEPPMAFQILLAGLEPVSKDLFMPGQSVMEATPLKGWNPAAWMEIRKEVEIVKRVAELRSWVVDQRGRYQGELYLGKETGRIHLNEMLIEKKFAVYSQWQVENDMAMTGESDTNRECSALDMRDTEIASWQLASEEEDSGKGLEDFRSKAKKDSTEPGASVWGNLGHVKSVGRGRGIRRRVSISEGLEAGGDVSEELLPVVGRRGQNTREDVREQSLFQASRVDKAREFLEKLNVRDVVGEETG